MQTQFWAGRWPAALIVSSAFFLIGVYWYTPTAAPLTESEVDAYMAVYSEQTRRYQVRHDMDALQQFLLQDDGKPFYTVNLYRFHEEAAYAVDSRFSGSGVDAYGRFSAVMIKLLAARASHPVFGSHWSDAQASNWDRVVVVRYRSRRDMANLFATRGFAAASEHKWAAIKDNERMLVQAVHLPDGLAVAAIMAAIGLVIFAAIAAFSRSSAQLQSRLT